MIEQSYIRGKLAETRCYKCGETLGDGTFAILNDKMPFITIGHVICPRCQSQSVVTLTVAGNSVVPMNTDLVQDEIVKYAKMSEITYSELLDLHKALKKDSICKLMRRSEKNSERKTKP